MKIYFDESGQSGCLLQKDDLLNFKKQPTFTIGALILPTENEKEKMIKRYVDFKKKFNIIGEIKGNDIVTKKHNDELKYFINNIIDDSHFFVLVYDKKFYISTLLLISLLGIEYQQSIPEHFYTQASILAKQSDEFFINYLQYIENITLESFEEYLEFLINFNYQGFGMAENAVLTMSKKIIEEKIQDKCYKDFMTFGWYDDFQITNLINLNALSEIIYSIKSEKEILNGEVEYIHDRIKEYENTFINELKNYGINIDFEDSKDNLLLQIVDNFVSIFCHTYNKTIFHFKNKEEWKEISEWDLKIMSKIQKKISIKNINYTIPVSDWSLLLCVATMFSYHYPKKYRNNFHFNNYYVENLNKVYESIKTTCLTYYDVMETLKK